MILGLSQKQELMGVLKKNTKKPTVRKKSTVVRKPRTTPPPRFIHSILGCIFLRIPIRTVSEANSSDHWTVKAKRHKNQHLAIASALSIVISQVSLPVRITLTRYAPRKLDVNDNLPMSFKYIFDKICDMLRPGHAAGRADDTDQITVVYNQKPSKTYYIEIIIENI